MKKTHRLLLLSSLLASGWVHLRASEENGFFPIVSSSAPVPVEELCRVAEQKNIHLNIAMESETQLRNGKNTDRLTRLYIETAKAFYAAKMIDRARDLLKEARESSDNDSLTNEIDQLLRLWKK